MKIEKQEKKKVEHETQKWGRIVQFEALKRVRNFRPASRRF